MSEIDPRACETCGGDAQFIPNMPCEDCEGTGYKREENQAMSEVEEALASIQADHDWAHVILTDEIRRQAKALEAIASDPDQSYAGEYPYHMGRADGLRCAGALARAARHTDDPSGGRATSAQQKSGGNNGS